MADHDQSYKLLFSHPEMVRDLLEGFVRADWLAEIDYGSLEPVKGSYVSDDLRHRASDVVWRVRWGRQWLYVYLLIEFQSTVERFMAVRIAAYTALLYQDLIRTRQPASNRQLPPLLPIVLYNGKARWNAPTNVASLIQPGPSALDPYRLQSRYLLIDEGRYQDSELAPLRNLVAALFRLEHNGNPADIHNVLSSLLEWLKSPEQAGLRRAFAVWINRVILGRLPGGPAAGVEDLQTMSTLFETRFRGWAEDFERRCVKSGEVQLLERQLRKRFGELPGWVSQRLHDARPEQLERWSEQLLDADNLNAVFDGE
jgi:hypothetical protein